MSIPLLVKGAPGVSYERIVEARADGYGNLRLYCRSSVGPYRQPGVRMTAFHPAGEWASAHVEPTGYARVELEHNANERTP